MIVTATPKSTLNLLSDEIGPPPPPGAVSPTVTPSPSPPPSPTVTPSPSPTPAPPPSPKAVAAATPAPRRRAPTIVSVPPSPDYSSTDSSSPAGVAAPTNEPPADITLSPAPDAGSTPTPGAPPPDTPGCPCPSGAAMPTGNLTGWNMVFSDDFNGASLDGTKWGAYRGQPGGDPGGCWDPSHVSVSGGMLHLPTYQDPAAQSHAGCSSSWVSGGVSSARALKQTYGKYLLRVRADRGTGVSAIALLWPSSNSWPPEIDFFETPGPRTSNQATLHCGSGGNDGCQVHKNITADFSQWHTVGVEWTPQMISYTLDGSVWATTPSNVAPIPSGNMEMDIQAQAGTCGSPAPCPDATTPSTAPGVDLQVDWVVAYAAAGA